MQLVILLVSSSPFAGYFLPLRHCLAPRSFAATVLTLIHDVVAAADALQEGVTLRKSQEANAHIYTDIGSFQSDKL